MYIPPSRLYIPWIYHLCRCASRAASATVLLLTYKTSISFNNLLLGPTSVNPISFKSLFVTDWNVSPSIWFSVNSFCENFLDSNHCNNNTHYYLLVWKCIPLKPFATPGTASNLRYPTKWDFQPCWTTERDKKPSSMIFYTQLQNDYLLCYYLLQYSTKNRCTGANRIQKIKHFIVQQQSLAKET